MNTLLYCDVDEYTIVLWRRWIHYWIVTSMNTLLYCDVDEYITHETWNIQLYVPDLNKIKSLELYRTYI